MTTLSISIVSYNTNELIQRCIRSIYKYTKGITFEIIVVDNASTDGTPQTIEKSFPKVKLIKNKKNKFFSIANNQALKVAKGKYFLVLNADTFLKKNSFKILVDHLKSHPEVGAVEGLELYEDGKIVPTGCTFSTPLIDFYELTLLGKRIKNRKTVERYRMIDKNRHENFAVDVGCDAFLMVRTEIMKKIKGYDEKLLLFYTENDLCFRIKELGYQIFHIGNATLMHKVSASTSKIGWKKMDIYYQDLWNYYLARKNYISGTLLFVTLKFEQYLLMIRAFIKESVFKKV